MPVTIVTDHMPLPNFKTYSAISFILLCIAFIYSNPVPDELLWKTTANATFEPRGRPEVDDTRIKEYSKNLFQFLGTLGTDNDWNVKNVDAMMFIFQNRILSLVSIILYTDRKKSFSKYFVIKLLDITQEH